MTVPKTRPLSGASLLEVALAEQTRLLAEQGRILQRLSTRLRVLNESVL